MKNKILVVGIIFLLITIGLSGCNETETNTDGESETNGEQDGDGGGEAQSESFEGILMGIGGGVSFYVRHETYNQSYLLVDEQGQRYSTITTLESFSENISIGETVLIFGNITTYDGSPAIIVNSIFSEFSQCKKDIANFMGNWEHESGTLPWSYDNATWYFFANKTLIIETTHLGEELKSDGTWDILDCELMIYQPRYNYEFSNENNSLTIWSDSFSGTLKRVEN